MKIGYLMQLGADIRRPPFNGPANHTRNVVVELQKRNHQVKVLFYLDKQLWLSDGLDHFKTVEVKWVDHGLFRLVEKAVRRIQSTLKLPYFAWFDSIRFAAACYQELRDCDFLYERTSWMGYGGGLASRWLKIPLILEDNGDHLLDLEMKAKAPRGFQHWLALILMKISVRQAVHVISSGDGWKMQFSRRWGIEPKHISTVENGTTLMYLLSRQDLRSFNQSNDDNPIKLVYLGGFYAWHGVPILLKAFHRAVKQGLNAELLLVGAGVEMQSARRLVTLLHLEENVVFAGHLTPEEFAPILAAADIGLAPYCNWPEFSGLKIFDYKAAGLPAVVSGLDGMPNTVKHGETGWIVPPCHEDALLEAIVKLSCDVEQRRSIGRAARMEAEKLHTWHHTVEQLERIFIDVLQEFRKNGHPAN